MATRPQLERLVGKALSDADFRGMLLKDPMGAARSIGVFLQRTQADAIWGLSPDALESLAADFRKLIGGNIELMGRSLW